MISMPILCSGSTTSGDFSASLAILSSLSTIALRRAGRRHQAEPQAEVVAGQAGFRHGRHVGRDAGALRRGHRDGLELALLDLLNHRGRRREPQLTRPVTTSVSACALPG